MMPDILHDLRIKAPKERVFRAVSTPEDLDCWWTKRSAGDPKVGAGYQLWFGPEYDWRAEVTRCDPESDFELLIVSADSEWIGTLVGFHLEEKDGATQMSFRHTGWSAPSEHYRVSSYCWAMYLRVLKRFLEHGESIPYDGRGNA